MMNTNNEIITQPEKKVDAMISIIERAMSDPNVDVAKLEKLLELQERIMAKQAEIDFNDALARISEKMPRIIKNGKVGYKADKNDKNSALVEAFSFARYEDIDKVVRPLLVAEGFSLSFDTDMKDGGGVIMHGTLSHRSGHSRTASMPLALDNTGGKNNVQGMGSTVAYGKRYTMCMLLNIVTVGEDDDGQSSDFLDNEKAVEIDLAIRALADADDYRPKFLKYMRANNVQEIKQKDYQKAKAALDAKAKKEAGI